MNTSEQYHQPVLEALCAFVRDGTIGMIVNDKGPAIDIQAALTVIGRRKDGPGGVDLANANIPSANLREANLSYAELSRARLSGAKLNGANLSGARLGGTDLSGEELIRPDRTLGRITNLTGANLSNALLPAANLSNAFMDSANLSGAHLLVANLSNAFLFAATLSGASLSGASLRGATGLTQEQLDQACGTDATLPEGLTLKPCPEKPVAPPLNLRSVSEAPLWQ